MKLGAGLLALLATSASAEPEAPSFVSPPVSTPVSAPAGQPPLLTDLQPEPLPPLGMTPIGMAHPLVIDTAGRVPMPAFRTDEAMGAALDGGTGGQIAPIFTPHNLRAMKSAGLRPVSYRLRTELGIEVWHWNPRGTWSDPARRQGYWTSSDRPGAPIRLSYGYRPARRGDSIDNANESDFSRLTDGDRSSFWKSNPYLDPMFLKDGEDHPQWLYVRLRERLPVDMVEIDWAAPYATRYEVQYWTGVNNLDPAGRWVTFPHGAVTDGKGGVARLHLSDQPITTGYVRVLMRQGSGTAMPGESRRGRPDWRDRAGFAMREIGLGTRRPDGTLADLVVHKPDPKGQTFTHVSSTDPWHRASDIDRDLEQPGIDLLYRSRLGFGLPVMMPTGLLYDTPENVAAEARYLARRRYPVSMLELGEEPDGQYASPADAAALYALIAGRVKGIIPGARVGGTSLQEYRTDTVMLPEEAGSWNGRFVDYLKRHHRLSDLQFMTFEYYAFDDICGDLHQKLIQQSRYIDASMRRMASDGVPGDVPILITEYGFSAFSGRAMSEFVSAELMAEVVARYLALGARGTYMFGYAPDVPINQLKPCAGWGNMMPFMADRNGQAKWPMPSFYAARLLAGAWAMPGNGLHRMVATEVEAMPGQEVVAFTARRPDGRLAVLAINRSASASFHLPLLGAGADGKAHALAGPAELWTYGQDRYTWLDAGEASHPAKSLPPVRSTLPAGPLALDLKPDSIAVLVLPAAKGN